LDVLGVTFWLIVGGDSNIICSLSGYHIVFLHHVYSDTDGSHWFSVEAADL